MMNLDQNLPQASPDLCQLQDMLLNPSTPLTSQEMQILLQTIWSMEQRNLTAQKLVPAQQPMPIPAFKDLWVPTRYKFAKGGRGSAKSWEIAKMLVWKAHTRQRRILCTRELQVSIKDSVHKLLKDTIMRLGLLAYFHITDTTIRGKVHGSEFIFKGLKSNESEIKSTEGITDAWCEEAESTSSNSLLTLKPTVRAPDSELIFSWNPVDEDSPIDVFHKNPPERAVIITANWRDNPYFTDELEMERQYCLLRDPDNYDWIWEGGYRRMSQAAIFTKRVKFEDFETPDGTRFFHGADFGFANDPSVLIRCFIIGRRLYIDQEAFGYGVEIDDTPKLYDRIPTSRKWPIKGDCSRPETISYLHRQGFNISAAKKWPNSVEDGVAHLLGFEAIVIHPRCVHMTKEARLYSYKVDKHQLDSHGKPIILPEIVDAWNHGWDGVRYALDGYIKHKTSILEVL